MIKNQTQLKSILLIAIVFLFTAFNARAQDKTKLIGNKPRHGSSNSTSEVIKGNQLGIVMKAGHKPVQLLKLEFGVENTDQSSHEFKVNVYEFTDKPSGENLLKENVFGIIPKGKNRVSVDLSTYDLIVKGDILVAIEWTKTVSGANPHFAIGLFNGGSYVYEGDKWKKIPVAGFDFNMLVKKLK